MPDGGMPSRMMGGRLPFPMIAESVAEFFRPARVTIRMAYFTTCSGLQCLRDNRP